MRAGQAGGIHLTYCSNIHPGESWQEVWDSLEAHAVALKSELSPVEPFGLGLRISNQASLTLLEPDHLLRFRRWLEDQQMYVFTMNGFPYGSFHRDVVKDRVYAPDWRTRERVEYTIRLAKILSTLLPRDVEGGISTSPLSYKPWIEPHEAARNEVFEICTNHLVDVVEALMQIYRETGKIIHVDIEPEPDCLIENTAETVEFFTKWLLPWGGKRLADRLGLPIYQAEACLSRHIRVCYDTCHFAVEYEQATTAIRTLHEAGIRIGKLQISAAVKVELPPAGEARAGVRDRLTPFAESTYLHQVVEKRRDGSYRHFPDLSDALACIHDEDAQEWRIHFHVPIFIRDYHTIQSTQDDIVEALGALRDTTMCDHYEIETYTWDVLPADLKQDLTTSIRREYEWVLSALEG